MRYLQAAVARVGGTMEQDNGGRFEVWQCCAPYGHVWVGGSKHIRLEWQPGVKTSKAARQNAVIEALECVQCGVRVMTDVERLECDEPATILVRPKLKTAAALRAQDTAFLHYPHYSMDDTSESEPL